MGLEAEQWRQLSQGATLAGMGIQAGAAYGQGKTGAAIAKFNAAAARRKAARVREVGAEEQLQLRKELRRNLARNRVATAVAGFQMTGSPLEAQLMVIRDHAADISETGRTAEIEARQLETEAVLSEKQAKAARRAGKLGVAQALIGGVSSLAMLSIEKKLAEK